MCLCLIIMSFGELLKKCIYSFRLRLSSSLKSVIDNIYSTCLVFLYIQTYGLGGVPFYLFN